MSGTKIHLENCSKTFPDGTRALLPTNIDVSPGEILALLGPSGCGKTTMLRIIAGLEMPDAGGRIMFDDTDVSTVAIEKRSVGMVFQSYALFPNMTVRDNIGYGLKIKGIDAAKIKERVDEVIELCQLEGLGNRNIKALSGGQRQRVAVARAVAPQPKILLLDEPLSALDAGLRDQLRDELALLLRKLSITTVFVTHDQSEAMAIADRVAVMRSGKMLQIDDPRSLYSKPSSAFVARFVGAANELSGVASNDKLSLQTGTLTLPKSGSPQGPTTVYVRQEAIKLTETKGNGLEGTVVSKTFLGSSQKVVLSGVSDKLISVVTDPSTQCEIGQTFGLSIKTEDILVLEDQ
ncbi:ABC transporter ATP-binding protein [Lentilitoribacter sp. Alg239-R112]|uniref:ABC transporter ATP-binding protein n=1 Tax=Lentilitoribacter sp. Alg239-R112 TaxID=2305987 RepID=UPI0013A6DD7D|nr:ABC transporter ATP-binding protein [Lentilitoribacter sp. Alg239-R112]